ncbi:MULTISPECIES: hypothetical protein [Microbacterium]|uniref:hypothetical protein n=1 Tax=Microbacterium TaxID=33882 RepID=UPI00217DF57C|nr:MULTISPECIES: hypothetical protein [Microbacterium]UWF78389.1 hypothetical protein JSY13_05145 [Microbacterium neungamense]WCM56565.1 hypothetical protein JRG78_05150 [Microbacterium sp. EF45047]
MRYLFSTGLFGAITAGATLLRGSRDTPITWRAVLAWVSWGITLALAIGTAVDMRRDARGLPVAPDSPVAEAKEKRRKKEQKERAKAEKKLAKLR